MTDHPFFRLGRVALLLGLCLGCSTLDPDIHVRRADRNRHGADTRPVEAADSLSPPLNREGLLLVAVDYPAGYDWRRDSCHGEIVGRVLLLKVRDAEEWIRQGGELVLDTLLSLPAGAGQAVSLDADRHQLVGGHLYSECLTESGTVYRCDGQTVLRTTGPEYLRGILPLEDGLYTLSQRMEEGGFVLRRNWKPVFTSEEGILHGSLSEPSFAPGGALFESKGEPDLFYRLPDGTWHRVRGAQEISVPLPREMSRLYDIRCYDGVIHVVYRTGAKEPLLYVGGRKYDLSATWAEPALVAGFHLFRSAGGGASFYGEYRLPADRQRFSGRWSATRLEETREDRCEWIDRSTFVRKRDGGVVEACFQGTSYTLDGSGSLMMPACLCCTPDGMILGLTPQSRGRECVLWANGHSGTIGINGFLSSVRWVAPQ